MTALTPPMGWNSWDCYGAAVTEEQVMQNAAYMAEHLKAFGWEYVVVDIQWASPTADSHSYQPFSELKTDEYGRLVPAENRFPSAAGGKGFAPLAEKIHGMGLKFGIHIMRGMPRMAAHLKLPIEGSEYSCADAADPHSISPGTRTCTACAATPRRRKPITKAFSASMLPGVWTL